MEKLNYQEIDKKWQAYWQVEGLNQIETALGEGEKKFYILDMFPYPSGTGLHVGHPKGYIATDIYSRLKKMQGYQVLHPMGFDAFGLPAEQFALKNKLHPRVAVEKNIARYKEQLSRLGLNYDWSREIRTTDPKFYKWTQWMFKQMYKQGLAYESNEPINWCPVCKTGLANEDLVNGNRCERCGSLVEKRKIRQWVIKITDYADRLLEDLEKLDWEPHIKELQRNWIGKSVGSEIDFQIVEVKENNLEVNKLKIFTTRADTLFGCTFMAISYTLAKEWMENGWQASQEIKSFIEKLEKEEKERTVDFDISKLEKVGINTGIQAINPANHEAVPIYIANYILSDYGTGAIMAVPAHDERDFEFARKYNLEIREVIIQEGNLNSENIIYNEKNNTWSVPKDLPINDKVYTGKGLLKNSGEYSFKIRTEEAKIKITEKVGGKIVSKYKLKDWVFARQRYWGEPFPIVFDEQHQSYAVADSELPVTLPEVENYEPTDTGESPLANISNFVEVYGYINQDGEFESLDKSDTRAKKFSRETNTMPQWAGSSWYWMRYIDPQNEQAFVDKKLEKIWDPVDFYVGGAEHATRHLIYARFWYKFLFDIGVVNYDEPFTKLKTVGLIMAEDGRKMSKRYGNVINPDKIVEEFGADILRTYEMFMGPFEKAIAWNTKGLLGISRFLDRVYDLVKKASQNFSEKDELAVEQAIHQAVKKIGADIENFKFNTAVSQLMIALNVFEENLKKGEGLSQLTLRKYVQILAPFAPHLAEEIWQNIFKEKASIHISTWPAYDEKKSEEEIVEIAIQISGKFRGTLRAQADLVETDIQALLRETEVFKKYVAEESSIKRIIFIKNKVINLVI